MQDDFVADIGDYGKYGLLRALNRVSSFRLGIVWMKTKPLAKSSSRTFEYFDASVKKNEALAACDPGLYRILKSLAEGGKQTIAGLEASDALPADTVYFSDLLDFRSMPPIGNEAMDSRLLYRKEWFRRALSALQDTELAFFDPDNGLGTPSKKRYRVDGPRYVWYDEFKPVLPSGKSLIVYQHGTHEKGGAERVISRRVRELRDELTCQRIWAVRWHRVQSRSYFVIPAAEHIARMERAISWLKESSWCQGGHFSVQAV